VSDRLTEASLPPNDESAIDRKVLSSVSLVSSRSGMYDPGPCTIHATRTQRQWPPRYNSGSSRRRATPTAHHWVSGVDAARRGGIGRGRSARAKRRYPRTGGPSYTSRGRAECGFSRDDSMPERCVSDAVASRAGVVSGRTTLSALCGRDDRRSHVADDAAPGVTALRDCDAAVDAVVLNPKSSLLMDVARESSAGSRFLRIVGPCDDDRFNPAPLLRVSKKSSHVVDMRRLPEGI
jgi:hypothetical protein